MQTDLGWGCEGKGSSGGTVLPSRSADPAPSSEGATFTSLGSCMTCFTAYCVHLVISRSWVEMGASDLFPVFRFLPELTCAKVWNGTHPCNSHLAKRNLKLSNEHPDQSRMVARYLCGSRSGATRGRRGCRPDLSRRDRNDHRRILTFFHRVCAKPSQRKWDIVALDE